MSNMKQGGTGLLMYEQDYDDRLPLNDWMDNIKPYTKAQVTYCVEARKQNEKVYGHAMESTLFGKEMGKVANPGTVALLYDSRLLELNAAAPILKGIMMPGRHQGKNNIGALDGHVKAMDNSDLPAMRH